jgi:hypothetical protein
LRGFLKRKEAVGKNPGAVDPVANGAAPRFFFVIGF